MSELIKVKCPGCGWIMWTTHKKQVCGCRAEISQEKHSIMEVKSETPLHLRSR